jgi:hypothetical protein
MSVKFNDEGFDLKYLFVAVLVDGTKIEQTPDDVSKFDPTRSAFFDVVGKVVERFELYSDDESFSVSLKDGSFQHDFSTFRLHDEQLKDYKLIYFRRHKHHMIAGKQVGHDIEYHFGWEAKGPDGKNIQRTIILN